MENQLISRISKGTNMDQIYIPKNRMGFEVGQYVIISNPDNLVNLSQKLVQKSIFYNLNKIEPIKLEIINRIFDLISKINPENIIITGSFLESGFNFNDIDILIIKEEKINKEPVEEKILSLIGIKPHIIVLNMKTLSIGLKTDPLYNLMLSRYISQKRILIKIKREINYKLLDLNLLKSKTLIENFDILNGNEKYYLTLNMTSILLFIQNKNLTKDIINREIEKLFDIKIEELKENILDKSKFIKKYKEIYDKTFELIMKNISKHEIVNNK